MACPCATLRLDRFTTDGAVHRYTNSALNCPLNRIETAPSGLLLPRELTREEQEDYT